MGFPMNNTEVANRKVIQIGERKVLIGSRWDLEDRAVGPLLNLSLRSKASKNGLHYASTHSLSKNTKTGATQYTFLSEQDVNSESELLIAESIIASNIKNWINKEYLDSSTILIYSIRDSEVINSFDSKFWILPIDSTGRIESENQSIVSDRYSLKESLDLYSITTEKFNIIYVEKDTFVADVINEYDGELNSSTVIPLKEFVKVFNESEYQIKRIYKPSPFKAKKVAIVSSAIAASFIAWAGFSYLSQIESFDFFENPEKVAKLSEKKNSLRDLASSLKSSSSSWTNESFREETLNQFIDGLKSNLYEPFEIALIIQKINNTLPLHAMEWKLVKLSYQNNLFFARYERIQNAQGVYYILDEYIEALDNTEEDIQISPFNLLDDGETRIYTITPIQKLKRKELISSMDEKLRKENELESKVRKDVKVVSDRITSLTNIYSKFNELTFTEKWIKRTSIDLLSDAKAQEVSLDSALSKLHKSEKKLGQFEKLEVPQELVLGQTIDFVTMLQIDSFFKWSFPAFTRGYPDSKTLSDRTKKVRKSKKSKSKNSISDNIYKQAIESYNVVISTRDSEEEGKVQSYGISDMIQLGNLINKPFVNIDLVDYDKTSEQWKFEIHFHTQTHEYAKRILQKKDKEVK